MRPLRPALAWVFSTAIVLGGCAAPFRDAVNGVANGTWSGRMSVRIQSDPLQSFFAPFELHGSAQAGSLSVFTPLGATAVRLTWAAGGAHLHSEGKDQSFDSLDALTRQLVGAELPVASLFDWLAGRDTLAQGWTVDLQDLAAGRLVARRAEPPPAVELRLILDH